MLTVYKKDATSQIVKVDPQFYQTEVQGTGKFKKVITPQMKAVDISYQLSLTNNGRNLYSGHTLTKGEDTLVKCGYVHKKFVYDESPFERERRKKLIKIAKREFRKEMYQKNSLEIKMGKSLNKVWLKSAQKFIIASSNTQKS
jgi:hypothetical protein